MEINFLFSFLIILIYLPVFLFSLSKKFKKKFMKIHSKKLLDLIIEVLAGLNYFLIFVFSFFIDYSFSWLFYIGIPVYFIFLILTYSGYLSFYAAKENKLVSSFPYSISRNPTYLFGLLSILGIAIALHSYFLFFLVLVQFFLTHLIILNEEKYCKKKYRKKYTDYCKKVRRYI